jgi:predicted TIM-barrel fold metal-dependent hydrolase
MKYSDYIDVHHHVVPEVYFQALQDLGIGRSAGKAIPEWTPENSLMHMEEVGTETAMCSVSEPAVYPIVEADPKKAAEMCRAVNEFLAELIQKYPGRFGAYALLPMPDLDSSIIEMEYALDVLKLDGVGLLSNYGEHYLGNRIFDDLFVELNKRNAIFYQHPSIPDPRMPRPEFVPIDFFQEFTFCTNRAATNLIYSGTLERNPNITPILSHMGGTFPYIHWRLDYCMSFSLRPNAKRLPVPDYIWDAWNSNSKSLTENCKRFYYDTALNCSPVAFEALDYLAPDNVVFGTDSFYASLPMAKKFTEDVAAYYVDENRHYAIRRGNAEKLFPRLKKG